MATERKGNEPLAENIRQVLVNYFSLYKDTKIADIKT
jgi:hypothetical protein